MKFNSTEALAGLKIALENYSAKPRIRIKGITQVEKEIAEKAVAQIVRAREVALYKAAKKFVGVYYEEEYYRSEEWLHDSD